MTGADQKIEHRVLHLAMVRARKVKAMTANVGLIAELEGSDIIVTMPEPGLQPHGFDKRRWFDLTWVR